MVTGQTFPIANTNRTLLTLCVAEQTLTIGDRTDVTVDRTVLGRQTLVAARGLSQTLG